MKEDGITSLDLAHMYGANNVTAPKEGPPRVDPTLQIEIHRWNKEVERRKEEKRRTKLFRQSGESSAFVSRVD